MAQPICPMCQNNSWHWRKVDGTKHEIGIGDIRSLVCVNCGFVARFATGKDSKMRGGNKTDEW